MPAWRSKLSWLLLVALIVAIIILAQNYTQPINYSVAWSANYAASSTPVTYKQYGLPYSSNWTLTLMPWYSKTYSLSWVVSWNISLMPWYTLPNTIQWIATWGARSISHFSYLEQQTIVFERDNTVSIYPFSGVWRGYVDISGYGSGNFTIPTDVTLVPLGNIILNGSKFTVSGSGRLAQQVKCYLLNVRNGKGDTVDLRASFNGTEVTIGYSFPCIVSASYNVSVSGYKVANIEVNGVKIVPPFMLPWMNTTEYDLYVTVADPVIIIIRNITVTPLGNGFVGVAVYGYVRDNVTKTGVPNGQVMLQYNGVTYDISYTKSDGSFMLYMTEKLSGLNKIRVAFSHIDYQSASIETQFTVNNGTGAGTPAMELPFNIDMTLIALAIGVIIIAVLVARKKGVLAVSVAQSEYLETS